MWSRGTTRGRSLTRPTDLGQPPSSSLWAGLGDSGQQQAGVGATPPASFVSGRNSGSARASCPAGAGRGRGRSRSAFLRLGIGCAYGNRRFPIVTASVRVFPRTRSAAEGEGGRGLLGH